ncbi:FliA/WhiG family RNA polymerase sigma factor [Bacillus massiliigorillae]|uniref:FliA/WhiG family RNA polymerase sigma factor n=1 Tax=Bacillus massiliigorillae TaxID=1243664 RepID=UPI00039B69FF|nr:FliA/WhiG family RNA polymerase sigma factor [Bacillus massiliigorillae]
MSLVANEEEIHQWYKWIQTKDSQAGDFLAKKYMPLVSYHVQRISVGLPKNVCRDDLRSLGMMGLFNALERFDPDRDLKFDTYASFRIRGTILDGLRKEDWLPRSSREKTKKIESVIGKLEQSNMRTVTPEEIANELNITPDEVVSILNENFFANVISVDENPLDQEDKEGKGFFLKDEKAVLPEENVLRRELYEELEKVILTLNRNEQLVLQLFYKEELTLTEIGEVMDLSTSRISQIHSKSIFKLRNILSKIV